MTKSAQALQPEVLYAGTDFDLGRRPQSLRILLMGSQWRIPGKDQPKLAC
jgi:hypothetical protein